MRRSIAVPARPADVLDMAGKLAPQTQVAKSRLPNLICQSCPWYHSPSTWAVMRMELKEATIDYREGDAELTGLLVWDGSELRRPGVLVVHGGAGLDDHARSRARQFAELGLLVFACDMYG